MLCPVNGPSYFPLTRRLFPRCLLNDLAPPPCTLCFFRDRAAFGKALSEDSLVRHHVAQSRMEIAQVTKQPEVSRGQG